MIGMGSLFRLIWTSDSSLANRSVLWNLYYKKTGAIVATFSTPNTGSYDWWVPMINFKNEVLSEGDYYLEAVIKESNGKIIAQDENADNHFSLMPLSIEIVSSTLGSSTITG